MNVDGPESNTECKNYSFKNEIDKISDSHLSQMSFIKEEMINPQHIIDNKNSSFYVVSDGALNCIEKHSCTGQATKVCPTLINDSKISTYCSIKKEHEDLEDDTIYNELVLKEEFFSPDEFKVNVEYNDKTIQIKKEVLEDEFKNSGIHQFSNNEIVCIVNKSNSANSTKWIFDEHIKCNRKIDQISKKKRKQCDLCHQFFSKKKKLIFHMKHHILSNKFLLKNSKIECFMSANLVRPKKISGEKAFKCEICLNQFTDYSNCRRHIRNHYNIVEKVTHICHICVKSFTTAFALKVHMRKHLNDKPFECYICQLQFHRKDSLQAHEQRTHKTKFSCSDIRCNKCFKTFSSNSGLRRHSKIHENKNQKTCNYCKQSFFRKDSLTVHIMSKHTGERPYKCNVCQKSFVENCVLKRHKKLHKKGKTLFDDLDQ